MKKLKNIKKLVIKFFVMLILALIVYGVGEWLYTNFDVVGYTILQPGKVRLMKGYQMIKLDQADQDFIRMFEIKEEL